MDDPELRTILRNLILPPTGPLLLVLAGLAAAWTRRFHKPGLVLAMSGVALLWLLSTPIISGQLVRWAEHYPALDLSEPVAADAVVILGGGTRREAVEYQGPAPKQLTMQRLAYGVRVARTTGLPVLVTGAESEGATMAEFLRRDFQISPRWVDTAARNTHENAKFSAALLESSDVDTIILVTSALHMRRAAAEFEAQGMRVVAGPVDSSVPGRGEWSDFVPGIAALQDSHYVLYELLAGLVGRARSVVSDDQ